MSKAVPGWMLLVLLLGCASGSEGARGRGSSDVLDADVSYVELPPEESMEARAGAFLPVDWEQQVRGGVVDPLEGAMATRPVRRAPGGGPFRRPPLLNPRPTPLQVQVRARRTVDATVVVQARQLYLQRLKEAQATYPNSAGYENHHLIPMYLGGAKDGQTYRLPTAYHKAITRAFREEWQYGQGRRPDPQALTDILVRVYARYPVPQLIGISP